MTMLKQMNMKCLEKNVDVGILILRVSLGVMMLLHGISKITHGISFIEQAVVGAGLPAFFAYGVYIGEALVPILLILGIATRASAAILAFNMLVAILVAHSGAIFSLDPMGGWAIELPALYLFGAIALIFTGGGKYAICKKNIWD